MKRPSAKQLASASRTGMPDMEFASRYPLLSSYLTDGSWDDGKQRELSTLSVSVGAGGIQVGLNDRALSRSAYSTAGSVGEALALLEEALKADSVPWRPWKRGKGGG